MNKYKMFLMLMLIIFPVSVHALDSNMFLECAKTEAKVGETVTCTVSAICSSECTTVEFGLGADTALSFVSAFTVPSDAALQPYEIATINLPNNAIGVMKKGNDTAPVGTKFTVGTFSVKVADSATVGTNYNVTLSNGALRNDSPTALGTNLSATASIKALAAETVAEEVGLSNLTVTSGGSLVPAFNKNQTTFGVYLESTDTTKFKLKAALENISDSISAKNTDTGETIDLNNEITFKPSDGGSMSIKITVGTGERLKEYTVIVQRNKPSGVGKATLSSLTVGKTKVNLVDGKFDYTVNLSATEIKDYVIVAVLSDSENFKFDNTDILSPHDLGGEQELEIKIVPKSADSSYGSETYTLAIKSSGSVTPSGGSGSSGGSSGSGNVNNNPQTGRGSAIVMGLLLVVSFIASIYFYKRNMSQYE